MGKTLILIRIFCKRGHCFPLAKKHLRPFAKRSVLRAYLRYGHAFTCVIHPGARPLPNPAKRSATPAPSQSTRDRPPYSAPIRHAASIDHEVVAGRRCERLTHAVLGKAFAGKL
jgi:hypothetical protein